MADRIDPASQSRRLATDTDREVMRARRAAQLRANLFKRKDQQRGRGADDPAAEAPTAPEDQIEVSVSYPETAPADAPRPDAPEPDAPDPEPPQRGRVTDIET